MYWFLAISSDATPYCATETQHRPFRPNICLEKQTHQNVQFLPSVIVTILKRSISGITVQSPSFFLAKRPGFPAVIPGLRLTTAADTGKMRCLERVGT